MTIFHTPGPWRMHDTERNTVVAVGVRGHGSEIGNTLNSMSTPGQAAGDARLFAATLDMLESLEPGLLEVIAAEIEHGGLTQDWRDRRVASLRRMARRQRDIMERLES